jgi:ATP-dependent protease ClpP protease subunit
LISHSYRRINGVKAKLLNRARTLNPALANDLGDLKLPWYYIRNVAEEGGKVDDDSAAEIFVYDEIGGSFGVDANEFIQDLQGIKAENLTVRINSPGGSVIDAIAIYNALVQHPAKVTTRVDSMAASAASVVAMAGDTIEMMIGSQLMIHDAMIADCGNARELREIAKWLDNQSDNIAGIYAERGRDKTADEWRALMLAETWMFADEAVELGLADSVYTRQIKQALEEAGIDPTEEEEPNGEDMPEEEIPEEETPEEEAKALALLMAKNHVMTNRGYKFTSRHKAPSPLAHRDTAKRSNDDEFERIHANYQRALAER